MDQLTDSIRQYFYIGQYPIVSYIYLFIIISIYIIYQSHIQLVRKIKILKILSNMHYMSILSNRLFKSGRDRFHILRFFLFKRVNLETLP